MMASKRASEVLKAGASWRAIAAQATSASANPRAANTLRLNQLRGRVRVGRGRDLCAWACRRGRRGGGVRVKDRKSTRLNSSHRCISYAVFCLKKKKIND